MAEKERRTETKVAGVNTGGKRKREKDRERGGESMAKCLIDAVYGVIIGHCVSLAWDSRKCDR